MTSPAELSGPELLSLVERFVLEDLGLEDTVTSLGHGTRRVGHSLLSVEPPRPPIVQAHLEELLGELVGFVLSFDPPLPVTVDVWRQRFGPWVPELPRPHVFDEVVQELSLERDGREGFVVVTLPRASEDQAVWPLRSIVVRRMPRGRQPPP